MEKIIVAFDVDGTLILNETGDHTPGVPNNDDVPQVHIINTLQVLSKFKNVRIVVWSGGGKEYAETWVRRLGLEKYVWRVQGKFDAPQLKPHIAIDDIQDTKLGDLNLIVRNK